ncbi:MAG: hypothetical protein ACFFD4_34405 [Candidatus Odinarchaeota archaeon]
MTAKKCPDPNCDSEEFYQDENAQWRCKRCDRIVQVVEPRKPRRPASTRRHKSGKTTRTKKIAKNLVEFKPSVPSTSVVVYCNRCHEELVKLTDYNSTELRRFKNRWKSHECKTKSSSDFYT